VFEVSTDARGRRVSSQADFSVRFLGFEAFHYHHHADEQWVGECLVALSSVTDDDGQPAHVQLVRDGDLNRIASSVGKTASRSAEPGCIMSYAYWNPALREQTRLLDPQTGKIAPVTLERAGGASIVVGGKAVAASGWRIVGAASPIEVWYSEAGDWIGLDARVAHGKHKLSYRLP